MKQFGTEFTIDEVKEYTLPNGVECWIVMMRQSDGGLIPHYLPKFAIEQRIAEYDLDPTDIAGVLEILLHEPWVADPTEPRNHANDPAAKRGMTTAALKAKGSIKVGDTVPIHLSNARDRATARQAHMHRIEEVKSRITINSGKGVGRLSPGDTTDPLQKIVDNHEVTEEGVKARAQYVEWRLKVEHEGPDVPGQMMVKEPGKPPINIHRPRVRHHNEVIEQRNRAADDNPQE